MTRILAAALPWAVATLLAPVSAQSSPFTRAQTIFGPRFGPAGVAAADFDLDGRRDLAVANGIPLDLRGPASAYLLGADGRVRAEHLPPTGELGVTAYPAIAAGDFTGDSLPDVLTVSDRGAYCLHVHQGPTRDPGKRPRFALGKRFRYLKVMTRRDKTFLRFRTNSLLVRDFDGDGRLDAALAGDVRCLRGVLDSSGLTVLLGDGAGGFKAEVIVDPGRFLEIAAHDVDRDGDWDLVGLAPDNSLVVARNDGSARFRKNRYRLVGPERADRLAVADLDGDGNVDYVCAGGTKRPEIVAHGADRRGVPCVGRRVLFVAAGKVESMVLRDFDADGRCDAAVLVADEARDAEIVYLSGAGPRMRSTATLRLPMRFPPESTPTHPRFLSAADLDGDGDDDLLVASATDRPSGKPAQWVFRNATPATWGLRWLGTATPGSGGVVPRVTATMPPRTGSRGFAIRLADAPAAARATLMLSTRLERRHAGGLTLHVFPLQAFTVTVAGRRDDLGIAAVTLPIPSAADLVGRRAYLQWVVRDPGARSSLGLAATRALEVTIGPR